MNCTSVLKVFMKFVIINNCGIKTVRGSKVLLFSNQGINL